MAPMAAGMNLTQLHTVLLVDDDPDVLAALRRSLRRANARIETTTSPEEAARRLETMPVDLIISDVDMPVMNGHELMRVARERRPDAVRVLLTGRATKGSALRGINEGEVHRFLEKPFDPVALRQLVAEALERKDELAARTRAGVAVERRHLLHEALEREHPGITQLDRDADGVYALDADRALPLIEALGLG
jgi:two-component system, probable response regulator PhcQ